MIDFEPPTYQTPEPLLTWEQPGDLVLVREFVRQLASMPAAQIAAFWVAMGMAAAAPLIPCLHARLKRSPTIVFTEPHPQEGKSGLRLALSLVTSADRTYCAAGTREQEVRKVLAGATGLPVVIEGYARMVRRPPREALTTLETPVLREHQGTNILVSADWPAESDQFYPWHILRIPDSPALPDVDKRQVELITKANHGAVAAALDAVYHDHTDAFWQYIMDAMSFGNYLFAPMYAVHVGLAALQEALGCKIDLMAVDDYLVTCVDAQYRELGRDWRDFEARHPWTKERNARLMASRT